MHNLQTKTIYCDEAGFTGDNLLSQDQPYFAFSSVVIDPEEAQATVAQVLTDYRIQAEELKGSRLIKRENGQRAALWMLEKYAKDSSVIVFDKKYSLAGKLFEYIFEPVLASQSSLFYEIHFHRFISNVLYLEFIAREAYAEEILSEFESAMRTTDINMLDGLFTSAGTDAQMSSFLRNVLAFCLCHMDAIVREINSLREHPQTRNWVLELSGTALHSLLATWGEKIDCMEVYCDRSKPLAAQGEFFDVMINREDKVYIVIDGLSHPLSYKLAQPIQLVDSKTTPGIQIADVIGSSIAYSLMPRTVRRHYPFKECVSTVILYRLNPETRIR
jgi:hypothetical protein